MKSTVKVTEVWSGLTQVSVLNKLAKASALYFDKQVNTELSHFSMQVCWDSLLNDNIT